MKLKYTGEQRKEYLNLIDHVGQNWLQVFKGDPEFYSSAYWDLLTRLWKSDRPVRKTDALKFMIGIKSAQTAGKYLETAIEHDFIREEENSKDARSKLVSLSPEMRDRLDELFDRAVGEVRATNQVIEKLSLPLETS
ncbi:MAG: hypothetical protein O3A78_03790 [Nitrospinae bacterium]|jgi:hypothetical protein|nr:hypothetical protein [Nitrospinota bacterium]MDA1108927.1 hypothetical protein [Nitrospinota bacterium]